MRGDPDVAAKADAARLTKPGSTWSISETPPNSPKRSARAISELALSKWLSPVAGRGARHHGTTPECMHLITRKNPLMIYDHATYLAAPRTIRNNLAPLMLSLEFPAQKSIHSASHDLCAGRRRGM